MKKAAGLGLIVVVSVYALIALFLAKFFPPVTVDDITGIVGAISFSHGHGYHNFLLNDVLPVDIAPYIQNIFSVGRPFYMAWYGFWLYLVPTDWFWARAISVLTGIFTLFVMGYWGHRQWGKRGWLMSGLLLLQPAFWLTSLVVNELLLAALATSVLLVLLSSETVKTEWGAVVFGATLPTLVLIHPYTILSIAALLLLLFINERMPHRTYFLMGLLIGGLIVFWGEPWRTRFQNPVYFELVQPPLLQHLSLSQWGERLVAFFTQASTFYCAGAESRFFGLKAAFGLFWIGPLIAGIFLMRGKKSVFGFKGWLWALAFMVAGHILLINRYEGTYQVLLLPWVVPALATVIRENKKISGVIVLSGALAMGSLAIFIKNYVPSYPSHEALVSQVKELIEGDAQRVMAPTVFVFDFPNSEFRDVSVLGSAYLYTGAFRPQTCLSQWSPDVLIADRSLMNMMGKFANNTDELSKLFGKKMIFRGKVATESLLGDLFVFRLEG